MIDECDLAQNMHENPMHWADEYLGLLTENERLREDQRRLEWCASNQAEFYRDEPYWIIRWIDPAGDWLAESESAMAEDWRDAIDQAMCGDTPNVSCETPSVSEGE